MSIHRNTIYNLSGSIIPLLVSLVTVPIYLGLIGEARYGILSIAWLLLGYFGLFDLGLGRATAQRIAALPDESSQERAQTFWTALIMNVGLGLIGALLILPIASYFFGSVFKVEEALRPEIRAAVPWLIFAVPMATLSGVLSGALQGRERFLELNIISVTSTVLFQLLPLAVAWLVGVNLVFILPAALSARLLTLVILFQRCRRHVILGYAPCFVRSQAGLLLRFGGWVTVTSFVGPMMVILDRFIIGAMIGAKSVTYYTVPFQLGERSAIIPNALTTALFPRLAAASLLERQRLTTEALHALLTIMTPIVVIGILIVKPFLYWWVGPGLAAQSALVGQVILLGFWVNGLARVPYALLQACGRPDLVAKCHLIEVLPYFGLLYLGLSIYGLVGAATVFSVRTFADFLLLAGFAGAFQQVLRLLVVPFLLLMTAFLLSIQIVYGVEWFILAVLLLFITTTWAWRQAPGSIRSVALKGLEPMLR